MLNNLVKWKILLRKYSHVKIFDTKVKRLQRDRSAQDSNVHIYETLKEEFAMRLADRIKDIKRNFCLVLDLGSLRGHLLPFFDMDMVDCVFQYEMSRQMLVKSQANSDINVSQIQGNSEKLCFRDNIFDMVVSNLSMHWINDIPGTMGQVYKILKPDGVFMVTMFGHDTLYELRSSLQMAEIERHGGFSPRVSPFVTIADMGRLLHAAGFKLLTLDVDEIVITYPSMFELMDDLRGMGESKSFDSKSATTSSRHKHYLSRETMLAAAAIYQTLYPRDVTSHMADPQDSSKTYKSGISSTFQIVNMIGWKPDPSQPQPAQRGSGQISLKDIDSTNDWKINTT